MCSDSIRDAMRDRKPVKDVAHVDRNRRMLGKTVNAGSS